MRRMLALCEDYAVDYCMSFNANKSNCLVFTPNRRHSLRAQMSSCCFSVSGTTVVNADSYVHLGHVINCHLNDKEDVTHRRNCFIGQSNNVLCYFNKLDLSVRVKLFKSYCSIACMDASYGH